MKKLSSNSFKISIAPKPGADATSYWLVPSVTQVKSYDDGYFFTPEYVSCDSYSKVGANSPVTGAGTIKFAIRKFNGNSTPEEFYTAPIKVLYQYASIDFILYVADQAVDRKSVSVVNDGEGGMDAVVYWLSPSSTQVKRRIDGVAIPDSVSCTKYRRVGSDNGDITDLGSIRYVVTYLDGMVDYEYDYVSPLMIDSNFASINFRYYIRGRLVNEITVPVIDDGLAGPMGQRGMLPYPVGEFNINTVYTATKNIAPYVYYVDGKTYYVMNREGVSVGINPVTDYALNGHKATWIPFENYKAIYVEMLMARFGMIGKAVFYDEYMFSQHGTDLAGNPTTNYDGFKDGTFIPNLQMNFLNGEVKFNSGIFRGHINAKSGKIGGFNIDRYGLSNDGETGSYIYIDVGEGDSKRVSVLGNRIPASTGIDTSSLFIASGPGENRAMIASASGSTSNYNVFGGKVNLAFDVTGGVNWNMKQDDHFCMPGVLACVEYTLSHNNLTRVRQWGNGCLIDSLSIDNEGLFRLTHDIGHGDYYAVITPYLPNINGSWWSSISNMFEKTNTYIGFQFRNDSGSITQPSRFEVMLFGRPSVNM